MILSDGDIVLDFFEKFPVGYENIGLHLSGGADSALLLYCLVKMVEERDTITSIYPITGYDVTTPDIITYESAQSIIDWIQNKTKCNFIKPLIVLPYMNKDDTKDEMVRVGRRYLNQRYGCEVTIDGTSLGMQDSPRSGPIGYEWVDDQSIRSLAVKYPYQFPWSTVNKKFIAAQYKKFGIEELSNLTNSCIVSSKSPCKECWWCKERYWAFGSYDGNIQ
jgi:hypothetical protein